MAADRESLAERWARLDARRDEILERYGRAVSPAGFVVVGAIWLTDFAERYGVDLDELVGVGAEIAETSVGNVLAMRGQGLPTRVELEAAHGAGFACGFFLGLDLGSSGPPDKARRPLS